MGNSQTPSRAELQRRRQQSARDRRLHQQEQELELERLLSTLLRQEIVTVVRTSPVTATLETMAPALPSNSDSDSSRELPGSLFYNEKYSDATLYLGESNTLFPAHQMVLGICSPYFDDALQSKFKEGITKEFHFKEDSPHALLRVLQYMYTGDYADEESESLSSCDDPELLKHPRVYALADMFRMEKLKAHSCKKFERQLQQHWISDTFADCIREVYSTSKEGDLIRKAVVGVKGF